MKFFEPFRPGVDAPWDRARAAHLARRAGFGATPEELDGLVELGLEGAVSHFVDVDRVDEAVEAAIESEGSAITRGGTGSGGPVGAVRREWFYRMVHGSQPLQEKLLLFWHDHFATQESKVVRAPLMRAQLETMRRRALGPFREMIGAIAKDPAMLVLLDNRLSDAANPNENWARELLELYTVGVDRYSQRDIVELARIFTGWTTPAPHVGRFQFSPEMHDTTAKVVFDAKIEGLEGRAGLREGEEALDLIVAREDCPRFLSEKLLGWFLCHEPPTQAVTELAEVLEENDLSIRAALSRLFLSKRFYESEYRFVLYKNPVELAAGTLHLLEVQNAHHAGLEDLTRSMGMQLFEPPSVAGWEHGEAWIDSGSVVQRFNFALEISELPHSSRSVRGRSAVNLDGLTGGSTTTSAELVEALEARLLQRDLDGSRQGELVAYIDEVRAAADTPERGARAATRAAIHMLLTTPEFALA